MTRRGEQEKLDLRVEDGTVRGNYDKLKASRVKFAPRRVVSATEALEGASELDIVALRAAVSDADGAA